MTFADATLCLARKKNSTAICLSAFDVNIWMTEISLKIRRVTMPIAVMGSVTIATALRLAAGEGAEWNLKLKVEVLTMFEKEKDLVSYLSFGFGHHKPAFV
jgi:hypothetical protein